MAVVDACLCPAMNWSPTKPSVFSPNIVSREWRKSYGLIAFALCSSSYAASAAGFNRSR
jgi:hypothetical protein